MPRRLLLADDSITIQKVIEIILAQEDFEIRSVGDGEEAVKLLNTFRPDVVLADVAMPLIDGYQLCEKIRGNPALSHVPVVMLAGAFEPYDEARANAVGARGVLIKPFESKELVSKIKSVLGPPADLSVPPGPGAPETKAEVAAKAEKAEQEKAVITEKLAEAQVVERAVQEESPVTEAAPQAFAPAVTLAPELEEFRKNLMDAGAPPHTEESSVLQVGAEREVPAETIEEASEEEVAGPDRQEILETIERTVDRRLGEIIQQQMLPDIASAVKESLLKDISARIPSMLEEISRDLLLDLSATLRPEIERQMMKAVPEVAEALIRKEIEKITSEG